MSLRTVLGVGAALLAITIAAAPAHADEPVVENLPTQSGGGFCYPVGWPGFQRGQSFVAPQSGTLALTGGPVDGASYVYGSVPATPACTASDGLSGLAGPCSVQGHSNVVGTHVVTASAADLAGNEASDTRTYTVDGWTVTGFRAPVDMGGAVNVVKAGATVPLKFSVRAGGAELTDPAVVASLAQRRISCDGLGSEESAVAVTSTGGTTLRYDQSSGQFVQNWKTPSDRGGCWEVAVTTQDGTTVRATFRLK